MSYLPKSEQARVRRKIEAAYNKPTYEEAKATLKALKPGLKLMNQSALKSLEEGLEETLTLHRLALFQLKMGLDLVAQWLCLAGVPQSLFTTT